MTTEPGQQAALGKTFDTEVGVDALRHLLARTMILLNGATPRGIVRSYPGAVLSLSGEPVTDFNVAVIEDVPEAEAHLREFHIVTQEMGLPAAFFIAPGSERLSRVAESLGLQYGGAVPLMVYVPRQETPEPDNFQVELVVNDARLEQSLDLMIRGFSLPPEPVLRAYGGSFLETPGFEGYVATLSGVPMGTGWTVRFGSIVGIYSMATPPEHQRRGAGRAVINAMLNRHLASGAKLFYLGATTQGFHLYESVGFRTVQEMPIWVSGDVVQTFK